MARTWSEQLVRLRDIGGTLPVARVFTDNPRRLLPKNIKASSLKAAYFLSTLAFPAFRPTIFMWSERAPRTAACYICHRPIPAGVHRITVHTHADQGTTIGPGAFRLRDRRHHSHIECFWEALQTNERPSDRLACFDCGVLPEGSLSHPNRVDIAYGTHLAYLCRECCDKRWWVQCCNCEGYSRQGKMTEVFIPEGARSRSAALGYRPGREGRFWACTPCVRQYRLITLEQHRVIQTRQIEEQIRVQMYRDALARGERPASPWTEEERMRMRLEEELVDDAGLF